VGKGALHHPINTLMRSRRAVPTVLRELKGVGTAR